MPREKLPNRRRRTPIEFVHEGLKYCGGFGHYDSGEVGEVFLSSGKPNSGRDIIVKDAAVAVSIGLQYGVPIDELRKAMLRNDDGTAAGPLGAMLDILAKE